MKNTSLKLASQLTESGFSIIEVIISAVIFSIVAAGLFATVSSLRTPATESQQAVTAALIGKQILENLSNEVDKGDWDTASNGLYTATASTTTVLTKIPVGGYCFTPTRTVSKDPAGTSGRFVELTISWTPGPCT